MQHIWHCVGARATGQAHLDRDDVCQDAFAWRVQHGFLCLAVADGAGSAAKSAKGSLLAVHAVIDVFLQNAFPADNQLDANELTRCARDAFQAVHHQLDDLAKSSSHSINDFACTLLFAALGMDVCVVAQIGDGMIVGMEQNQARLLLEAEQKEYVEQTHFVTQQSYADWLRIRCLPFTPSAVALLTDGLESVARVYSTDEPAPGLFEALFDYVRNSRSMLLAHSAVEQMLKSERVTTKSDDDKTLLMAVHESYR